MQTRGLLVAALALAILGGLVFWSTKTKKDDADTSADSPKILTVAEADLKKVELKRPSETLVLERNAKGTWAITAPKPYAADAEAVNGFTTALGSVTADKVVEPKVTDRAPYGFTTPTLVIVATTKNGKTHTLNIGDDTPTNVGTFAMLDGDQRLFTIPAATKSSLDKNVGDFRDKRLIAVNSEKIARIELTARKTTTEFGKNAKGEWQIVKPQAYRSDGFQVDELLRRVRDAKLNPTQTEEESKTNATAFAAAEPVALIKITDDAGTQTLELKRGKDKQYLARGSADPGIYSVTAEIGDGLDKATDDFRNKKLFDFGFTDPSRVDYKDAQKTRSFTKAGERWLESNKPVDSVGIQALIDKLRDLTATAFPAAGFTASEVDLTVTSDGGKRVEHVSLSKTPTGFIAKRDGDASLYALPATAVEELQRAAHDVKAAPPETKKK
jgi:hypothetical protein